MIWWLNVNGRLAKHDSQFSILHHVSHLIFNLVLSELLSVKIEESKFN